MEISLILECFLNSELKQDNFKNFYLKSGEEILAKYIYKHTILKVKFFTLFIYGYFTKK